MKELEYADAVEWSEATLRNADYLSGKASRLVADGGSAEPVKAELHNALSNYADYRHKGLIQPNVPVDYMCAGIAKYTGMETANWGWTSGDNLFLDLVAFFDRTFGPGSYKGTELPKKKKRR